MENTTAKLAAALRERLAIVADGESRRDGPKHMERLREISKRISEFESDLPQPVDPRLKHYLARCSYSKALEFLEGTASCPTSMKSGPGE